MTEHPERLTRPSVAALDAILGVPLPVLDDGFIRIVDYLGADESIVQAARVSYGRGTKRTQDDKGLIRYLLRHRHTTPFEMCEIKLHVRVPMDCWRQWIRHRTANVNEYSTRYSIAIDRAQRAPEDGWRLQAFPNRQGSAGRVTDSVLAAELSRAELELQRHARIVYEARLNAGIAREQARKDLPLSTYTEAYWKIDLHNLLHFLALRMDAHAQEEIRQYANIIGNELVAKWVPVTWQAFLDYRVNATTLSKTDTEIVSALNAGRRDQACDIARSSALITAEAGGCLTKSQECQELEAKLEHLGLVPPWRDQ
jgi:thymidylate synthase (FAD)